GTPRTSGTKKRRSRRYFSSLLSLLSLMSLRPRPPSQMRYPPEVMETTTLPPTITPERTPALDEKALNAYRRLGYLLADLDPLNRLPPATAPGLEDCDPATAEYAKRYYCGTIGVEYMHIGDPAKRRWIQERME